MRRKENAIVSRNRVIKREKTGSSVTVYTTIHTHTQSQKTNKKIKKQHEESTDKIPICLHQEVDYTTPHERQHTRKASFGSYQKSQQDIIFVISFFIRYLKSIQ